MRLDVEDPSLWTSTVHLVHDGVRVATFDVMSLRERLSFALDDRAYEARKAKDDGVLVLTDLATGLPLAQRVSLGAFSSDCDVEAAMPDGSVHVIRLDRASGLKRRFEMRVGGVPVGQVMREGLWKTKTFADVPDAWPLPLSIFVVWLCLRRFAAEDAAAAS